MRGVAIVLGMWLVDEPTAPVEPMRLTWRGDPSCPDGEVVRERLLAGLGAPAGELVVEASVSRDEARWRMALRIDGPAGRGARELEASSCDELVDAAAVVVAIAARGGDPLVPEPIPPAEPEVEAIEAAPPSSSSTADAEPVDPTTVDPGVAPARAPRRLPGLAITAGGGVDVGVLPRVGGTIFAEIAPEWSRALLSFGVLHGLVRQRDVGEVGGRFALWTGTVRAGPRWQVGRMDLAGVLGTEIGAVRAAGHDAPINRERTHLWLATSAAFEIGWRLPAGWSLGLSVAAVVPWRRWRFAVGDAALGQNAPVGGRFALRVAYERRGRLRNPRRRGQP